MKGKIKTVLLAMFLCLGISLQSMEIVHAAVNYEACPFCGTMVSRGTFTRILTMDYMGKCDIEENCDLYWVVYGDYTFVTCQTSGCPNYDREDQTDVWGQVEHKKIR